GAGRGKKGVARRTFPMVPKTSLRYARSSFRSLSEIPKLSGFDSYAARMRHPPMFSSQTALRDYARDRDLVVGWEGTEPWRKRRALLSPDEIRAVTVMCCTVRGMTRAMLVPKALVDAEREANTVAGQARAERERVARHDERQARIARLRARAIR